MADSDDCIFQSNNNENAFMRRKEASLQNTAVNQFEAVWFIASDLCCGGGLYWWAVVMQLVYQSHPSWSDAGESPARMGRRFFAFGVS